VPAIDYDRRGAGTLVSSGSGIMLAVMDACPRLARCVDLDHLPPDSRFHDWLAWMWRLAAPVAIVGWFSISDPGPLRLAIASLPERPLTYTPGTFLGGWHIDTLDDFLRLLNCELDRIVGDVK
jgi:hypothetical protein